MEIIDKAYYIQKVNELIKSMSLKNVKRIYYLAMRLWKKEIDPSINT